MADQKKSIGIRMSAWIAGHLAVANVLGFMLILLLAYLLVFSRELRLLRQSNRLQLLGQEKQAKLGYIGNLEKLEKNYDAISEDDRRRVSAMIPTEDDLPGIMASLEAVSQNVGITIGSMNFSTSTDAASGASVPGLRTVKINLDLGNADYQRFKHFLEALQDHLRLFDVQNVNMNPNSAQYSMTVRAYVQPRKP